MTHKPLPHPSVAGSALTDSALLNLLHGLDKPARYTGGELYSIAKPGSVGARMALCFPDLYEIAESHLGLKILYEIINRDPRFAAERVYALHPLVERRARSRGVPLWSLETRRPLAAFDAVGFTLQYELAAPTILAMLEHGGIPVAAADRSDADPIVIGGGAGAFNPEPLAPFFDAFFLGDAEEAILEILETIAAARAEQAPRTEQLAALGRIGGVYIPAAFDLAYAGLAVSRCAGRDSTAPARVRRRAVADLDRAVFPVRPIIPNVEPIHDRVAIEIQRGCSRGCRFCQAGMTTRPTRQRQPETVLELARAAVAATGCQAVGMLSLSAGDYQPLAAVAARFLAEHRADRVSLSLPSLRTETMTPELAQEIASAKSTTFTLAPEAGSERLRRVINKGNTEADLIAAVEAAVRAGTRQVKLYFMIGLPTETEDDLQAIVQLARRARQAGRAIRRQLDVVVAISTFVPKPHTPFQWERQLTIDETLARQQELRERLRECHIQVRYHDARQSFIEGVLARGDRRLAPALAALAASGCRLDAWTEHFDFDRWQEALASALAPVGLSAEAYLSERSPADLLPWDHLHAGVLKRFLLRERAESRQEKPRPDCAFTGVCYACGGCDRADPFLPRPRPARTALSLLPHLSAPTLPPQATTTEAREALVGSKIDVEARTRLRFRHTKVGPAAHLAQLDATSHILRAVRQSGLPVLYSEGHTPRPRVAFSPACPVGVESLVEHFDATCAGTVDADTFVDRLNRFLPEGMRVVEVTALPSRAPAVTDILETTTYRVTLHGADTIAAAPAQVHAFLTCSDLFVRVRRKDRDKLLDVRREVRHLELAGGELRLTLASQKTGSLKLLEAVAAILGLGAASHCGVLKEAITFADATRPTAPQPEPVAVPVPERDAEVLDLTRTFADRFAD